jgi:predicted HD phosphohydrolase
MGEEEVSKEQTVKFRVHYTYFDQTINKSARWEQRQKDFDTKEEARAFVRKIDWNVAVRNVNIQPVLA